MYTTHKLKSTHICEITATRRRATAIDIWVNYMEKLRNGVCAPTEWLNCNIINSKSGLNIDKRLVQGNFFDARIIVNGQKIFGTGMPGLNILVYLMDMHETINAIDHKINELIRLHGLIAGAARSGYLWTLYNIDKENIIHIIKRTLDTIVLLLSITYDRGFCNKDANFKYVSVGDLFFEKNDYIINAIKKKMRYEYFKDFFIAVNDLHNAYKHSGMVPDSRNMYSPEGILFSVFYTKHGTWSKTKYLCHLMYDIVNSYNVFMLDFFGIEEAQVQPILNKE